MDDIGLLEFETSRDLYNKLKHDYSELEKNECNNNYMNFIMVAYHLGEWIRADNNTTREQKSLATEKLNRNNYKLFNDLCNRAKHFKLSKPRRTITKDEYKPGFNWDTATWDTWTWDGPKYIVEQDGTIIDLLKECEKIFKVYQEIFE